MERGRRGTSLLPVTCNLSPNVVLSLALLVAVAACAPTARQQGGDAAGAEGAARSDKTLVAAIRVEPIYVAAKALLQAGVTLRATTRLFNAELAIVDDRGVPRPYLAEELPQLNTESWRVFPDGRMETTYRLKRDLTWHDSSPLSAEDFVFAFRVYSDAAFGIASGLPQGQMEDVAAPDQRTVAIKWRRPYPFAGLLGGEGQRNFAPLPRHILEGPLERETPDGFVALPFWNTEYVGLGPYRLDRWEPGAFIDAAAFSGHALGRPRIDRVKILFMSDPNTALANLLAESIHLVVDDAIYFQQAAVIKREWAARGGAGTVLVTPGLWRYTQVQLHPERVNPRALLDLRVRKALAHSIDKEAINAGIYEEEGISSDSPIPPTVDYFQEVDRAIAKYAYDPRQTERLMAEAGFSKASDGFFTSPNEGRFTPEVKVIAHTQNEAEMHIMAAVWRQAGFDVREAVLPAAQAQDGQVRATFSSMFTTGGPLGEDTLPRLGSAGIPRPENRWNGLNRSSWSNAEYDRLAEAYSTTLDRNERIQQIVRMMQIFTAELPALAVNFNPGVTAHVAALKGPQVVAPEGATSWNVHEWELR